MNAILLAFVMLFVQDYSPQTEPPIAYLDVVPQQDVSGIFNMGAVAYHLEGVDRVEYTIHREGFVGDWNRDGITDGDDLAVLLQRWGQGVNGKELSRLLGAWGQSVPHTPQKVTRYEDAGGFSHNRLNPRTGQEEYWFALDTRSHPDTKITVTAEVFPIDGPSVVLDQDVPEFADLGSYNNRPQYGGVNLFSNNSGYWPVSERYVSPNGSDETGDGTSENPYISIGRAARHNTEYDEGYDVGGVVVYLMEGEHIFGQSCAYPDCKWTNPDGRFVTITPAPGVNREDAKIVSGGIGLGNEFVRFKNVVVESGESNLLSSNGRSIRWYDNCILSGLQEEWWNGNYYKLGQPSAGIQYYTETTQQYMAEGMSGILMRNIHLDYIQCDMLEMHWIQMALNVLMTNHNVNIGLETACHTDYIQVNGGFPYIHQNIIFRDIYGNHSCREQGVHACPGQSEKHNVAWVNVELSNTGGNGVEECNIPAVIFRWCGPARNNLFKDCMFNGRPDGSSHWTASFDRFNEDGTQNTDGPWAIGHDGVSQRFINVKFEDCWSNWEKTEPLFLIPDAGEPWVFYGPAELMWDWDIRDDIQPNPFSPDEPWLSPITNILYTQTE